VSSSSYYSFVASFSFRYRENEKKREAKRQEKDEV